MKKISLLIASIAISSCAVAQSYKLNDLDYFEDTGVNIFAYSNDYNGMFCDEKEAGVEIIIHGVRVATGGGVRLMNTPEQWDIYPKLTDRKVDKNNQVIEMVLDYADYNFKPIMKVTPKDKGVLMSIYVDKPVPENLVGKAGMNIEFFPATYFGKTWLMDGKPGILPQHPDCQTSMHPINEKITQIYGLTTFDDRGRNEFIVPDPISKGHTLVMAPEDNDLRVTFKSEQEINLFDGRNLSSNGTFVVRTLLEGGKTGKVAEWYIEPAFDKNWVRKPNIGFSQVGYTPNQKKVAVLELDKNDPLASNAKIYKVNDDGTKSVVAQPDVKQWGVFYNRYNYATVDFSSVKEVGIYCIEYKGETTNIFPISESVYGDKWCTSLDVWLPGQMDHMEVKEAYHTIHGRSNMDDAMQAPTNYEQHDGYRQGAETFTKYKPYEHIPNLTVGGWYDAGDFDIQGGTVNGLTKEFAHLWELFQLKHDRTYIDQKTQFVDLHRPDGIPDVIQQCEHGALNVCAQVENIGFVCQGIVQMHMWQYVHIGDGCTQTDGKIYDPSLKPYEIKGDYSGTLDDRVAFTNSFSPAGTMQDIVALAAAARVLKDFNPELSTRCLKNAKMLWDKYFDDADPKKNTNSQRRMWDRGDARINAAIEMWRTTGEKKYKDFFLPLVLEQLKPREMPPAPKSTGDEWAMAFMGMGGGINLTTALQIYPYMDKDFQAKVKTVVPQYVEQVKKQAAQNPYGVPIMGRGWGGTEMTMNWAYNNYLVWRYFPDMIDPELVLAGINFMFGCHPYSNVSFVLGEGVNHKKVAYGASRAYYTTVAGGISPGLMMFKPDFFEHKDDYPFLWGENECCTRNVPTFIMFSLGCEEITKALNKK
ncbi:MAG: glycoside hydrolase family 9 protein [Bacteroidales bacterium]|nr:glycoside hydrolase family 9 protein [Bacteroidales bacterium]